MTQDGRPGRRAGSVAAPRPAGVLRAMLAATRRRIDVCRQRRGLEELRRALPPNGRRGRFRAALARPGRLNVIAECKRRSPSSGILSRQYDAAAIARSYERAGAAAVSVLTEPAFFDGSVDDLAAVGRAVSVPVLCKDFILDVYQLAEARAAGADAVLLIAAALDEASLRDLLQRAGDLGLDALVEVHDEDELVRALAAGAEIVGVNNRDLRTLEVQVETARRLADLIPDHVVAVAESGLKTRTDLEELGARGFDAFLIGEWFMRQADPGFALAQLVGSGGGA